MKIFMVVLLVVISMISVMVSVPTFAEEMPPFESMENKYHGMDSDFIILYDIPSQIREGEMVMFDGYLYMKDHDPEGFIVYIKDKDTSDPDDLLATAHVNRDGKFSAGWIARQVDAGDDLTAEIYAIFEGNATLSRLATCNYGDTQSSGKPCRDTINITTLDSKDTFLEQNSTSTTENLVKDEYIELYHSLDLDASPHVAIVPSPDSYDRVKQHIIPVLDGVLMWSNLLDRKYGGNWSVTFEIVTPGTVYFSSKPDITINIETNYDNPKCGRDYSGVAYIGTIKPVQTVVCANSYDVMTTAAHEFIHAMGLGHAFNMRGDLMCSTKNDIPTCPSIHPRSRTPSQISLDAVVAIYGHDGYPNPNNSITYGDRFPPKVLLPARHIVTIEPVAGSSISGCQDDGGCYNPMVATVEVGGIVIFSNTDVVAHTFTAGTMESGPTGEFDSGLAIAGSSFEYKSDTVGEFQYFCIVHPWTRGLIIVQETTQTKPVTLSVSAYVDSDGDGIRDEDEEPYSDILVLTYVSITDEVDLLITDMNGMASKTYLESDSFYVIVFPLEDKVYSTHQVTLNGTIYNGIIHVENPQQGSVYFMNVGIIP